MTKWRVPGCSDGDINVFGSWQPQWASTEFFFFFVQVDFYYHPQALS